MERGARRLCVFAKTKRIEFRLSQALVKGVNEGSPRHRQGGSGPRGPFVNIYLSPASGKG